MEIEETAQIEEAAMIEGAERTEEAARTEEVAWHSYKTENRESSLIPDSDSWILASVLIFRYRNSRKTTPNAISQKSFNIQV